MSAELAVTFFFLSIVGGLIILPLKVRLSKIEWLNTFLGNCCFLIALFLLSLTTAVMADIATTATLGINQEIFTVLWIVQWASYLFMLYLFIHFLITMMELWQVKKQKERMGKE